MRSFFCRQDTKFDKEKRRASFAIGRWAREQALEKAAMSAFSSMIDTARKFGRAPRSNVERAIQGWLEELLS